MKRYFIAGAVALTLGGGTFAFANSLSVSSTTLASGTSTVDSGCTAVAVDYTTSYNAPNGYKLATITLDGGTGCATQDFTVDVADGAGASLGQFTGSLVGGDATIIVVPVIDAAAVANVSAVINS